MELFVNKIKFKYILSAIVLFISIFFIIYGIINNNKFENFILVKAKIHQISKNENTYTLYLDFNVDNHMQEAIILTKQKDNHVGNYLNIFCDKNNLTNCVIDKKNNTFLYNILFGCSLSFISLLILKK